MKDINIGSFVTSKAGHDYGRTYVIIRTDGEYLYLSDGKVRTLDYPKKKNIKHVNLLTVYDHTLAHKVKERTVKDEEIKRSIKLLQV